MLNIGLLGCSSIAKKAILPALHSNHNFDLKYIASRSPEKGKSYASDFDCKFCSYDELLERKNIDAVYVSLPNVFHYQWGKKVLDSKKHLLLEKPFTVNCDEAKKLIELADRRRLVAMEGLMYVFHPSYKKVLELVRSGEIGELKHIEATFGFPYMSEDNIKNKADLGGGAILDNMIYPLSLCLNLANRGLENYNYHIKYDKGYQVDGRGFLFLNFGNIIANVNYGFGLSYQNNYSIWGSKARIKVNRAFTMPKDYTGEIIIETSHDKKSILIEPADHFSLMFDCFSKKITGMDISGINEGQDILRRIKIISDIYSYTKIPCQKLND